MRTIAFISMVSAVLLSGGCDETPTTVCIMTARDTVQADEEFQRFLASHDEDSLYEFSCRNLSEDVRRELLEVPPGGDAQAIALRQIDGDVSAEYIRVTSQQAEDVLAGDAAENIDVVWGVGISYLERAEDRQTDRSSLFYGYRSRAVVDIMWAIASWKSVSQDKFWWFVDPSTCGIGSRDTCAPRYVAASAYTNVLCINDTALADLEPVDCSCRDTGCSSGLGCPSVESCPEVYPLEPGRTEYSWGRLMCTPALQGHIAMPRPDSSGTGLIATHALSSYLGGNASTAVGWLASFARQQEVRFTRSGSSPCKMANANVDAEIEGGEDTVIGISYIAALKGIEKRAEDDELDLRVRAGTLESGLGYEPEGTALVYHEVESGSLTDERRLRRLGASTFVDWVLSAEGREQAARTSSVVVHPVDQVLDTGVCASILDCVSAWARLDYGRIPDDKFQVQVLFEAEVCGGPEDNCGESSSQ